MHPVSDETPRSAAPPLPLAVHRPLILTLLAVGLALFYRKPDALLHPQFWAEDGTIFFRENYLYGFGAVFTPYSGYYHVVLRLVAWAAGFLPILVQPALYAFATLGITLLVAAKLFSQRVHLPYKPWLALALVLVPRSNGEILLTLTALQWFLAVLPVLFLIQDEAQTPAQALRDLAMLTLVGLSGPFSILYLPLFALRALLVSRNAWGVLCAGVMAVCAAVQLSAVLHFPAGPNGHPPLSAWAEVFIRRPFGSLMLGTHIASKYLSPLWAVVLFAGLLMLLLALAARQRIHLWTVTALMGAAALAYASTLFRFLKAADVLFVGFDSADRYFYLPKLFFVWSLFVYLAQERSFLLRQITVGVLLLAGFAAATDFACPAYGNMRWTQQVRQFERGEIKVIEINPGWKIDLDKNPVSTAVAIAPAVALDDLALHQDILLTKPAAIRCASPLLRVTIDGKPFLQVHPISEMTFDIPPGSREAEAEFAIRPEAWQLPQHTGGAAFRVDFAPAGGGASTTLWSRALRPSEAVADRGAQTLRVALPTGGQAGQLVFRTLPPPGTTDVSNAWACWARVRFNTAPAQP